MRMPRREKCDSLNEFNSTIHHETSLKSINPAWRKFPVPRPSISRCFGTRSTFLSAERREEMDDNGDISSNISRNID